MRQNVPEAPPDGRRRLPGAKSRNDHFAPSPCLSLFTPILVKHDHLPRQARDRHKESSEQNDRFHASIGARSGRDRAWHRIQRRVCNGAERNHTLQLNICQDRLGASILVGKVEKKRRVSVFCRSWRRSRRMHLSTPRRRSCGVATAAGRTGNQGQAFAVVLSALL